MYGGGTKRRSGHCCEAGIIRSSHSGCVLQHDAVGCGVLTRVVLGILHPTLETQPLLDPADESLEFVIKKDNLRPMAIYRIDNEFLLCYDGESDRPYPAGRLC